MYGAFCALLAIGVCAAALYLLYWQVVEMIAEARR